MKRFKNILCVIDGQADEQRLLERAFALAENNQAHLTIAAVSEPVRLERKDSQVDIASDALQENVSESQARYIADLIEPYKARIEVNTRVLIGTPFLEIIREVLRNGHDLVLKSPESPDWLLRPFSSDDMNILRKCPCPVWMVKPEAEKSYRRILAAIDVDDRYPPEELKTRQALNVEVMGLAASLALSEFAELHVVHAWEAVAESALRHSAFLRKPEEEVDAYVETIRHHHAELMGALIKDVNAMLDQSAIKYIKPKMHMPKGAARKEIPAFAKQLDVDCVVMGTVARTGVRGFIMGNTAETILSQIDCSVLAIKPPGFETTVSLEN